MLYRRILGDTRVLLPNAAVYPWAPTENFADEGQNWRQSSTEGLSDSGGGKGGERGACAPGSAVQGSTFGGAKIWNSEIWQLQTNWRLHCRQRYFTATYQLLTLPSFGTTAPNCQCSTTPPKQCVHQETCTADMTDQKSDHSTAVKLSDYHERRCDTGSCKSELTG